MTDWLDKKLEEARSGAKNYGRLRGAKDIADDKLKVEYAKLYDAVPDGLTTVADKDAWVKSHGIYKVSIEEKANSYADWTAAELYMKILFAEVDKYRTDAASNRNIDRAHR